MIPPVVASDRGRAQTCFVATHGRGCRTAPWYLQCEKKYLESYIIEGDNPVFETIARPSGILSNAGHEESCANPPGPSGKAKYSHETDSEPVL